MLEIDQLCGLESHIFILTIGIEPMKKVSPEVAQTLRAFTGRPKRVKTVAEELKITERVILNHIRSARLSDIPVEFIGPMSHRYFYLPSEYKYGIKETIASQLRKILIGTTEEDAFSVEELADLLCCTNRHIRSSMHAWRKTGQTIYSAHTGTGNSKVYWTVPTEPVEQEP